MEDTNEIICPTETLIDLKEEVMPSHINFKGKNSVSDCHKLEIYLKDKDLFNIKEEDRQSILDVSPFRINDEYNVFNLNTLNSDLEQSLKLKEVNNDCPTAILVDLPTPSSSYSKKHFPSDSRQKDTISQFKSDAQELKDKIYSNSYMDGCSKEDFAEYSPGLNENNELCIARLRWKTPSPQSMSRISKEASKVIHDLNSSEIFDENSLLTEEMLPIPLNFDNFDLEDNIDKEGQSSAESNGENEILKSSVPLNFDLEDNTDKDGQSSAESNGENKILKSSGSVQTQNIVIDSKIMCDKVVKYASFPITKSFISKKLQDTPIKAPSETIISKVNLKNFNAIDYESKDLCSSEIYSDSLDSPPFSAANDVTDDVFIVKSICSEDKENIEERENCVILSEDIKTSSKTAYKRSKTKLEFRGTLRNVSNINREATDFTKCPSSNSNKGTLQRRMSLAPKTNEIQPFTWKQQVKKTALPMESQNASKIIPRSNSFQFQSTRELISNVEKPSLIMKNASVFSNSMCKSSSSDLKQQTAFTKIKTPSRRYSISTPLKSACNIKPTLTPALQSFQKPPVPRFTTPQSVRASRLSFSKSWQQPTATSQFSNSKGLKQQNLTSATASSNASSKVGSAKQNLFLNQGKQSFSQSMSAVSFRSFGKNSLSTSNKSRFCSKLNLPSPLHVEQDRKLARALFPNAVVK